MIKLPKLFNLKIKDQESVMLFFKHYDTTRPKAPRLLTIVHVWFLAFFMMIAIAVIIDYENRVFVAVLFFIGTVTTSIFWVWGLYQIHVLTTKREISIQAYYVYRVCIFVVILFCVLAIFIAGLAHNIPLLVLSLFTGLCISLLALRFMVWGIGKDITVASNSKKISVQGTNTQTKNVENSALTGGSVGVLAAHIVAPLLIAWLSNRASPSVNFTIIFFALVVLYFMGACFACVSFIKLYLVRKYKLTFLKIECKKTFQ